MRESTVEAGLVAFAKKNGIWTRKFSSPAHRGVPDRIFIHMGKVLFLEVKRPGEKPTQLQEYELQLIRDAGGMAAWVDSVELGIVTLRNYLMHAL